ncbi:hypothetical protein GCM10011507_33270 [Edaphobacter acidisoli]|uniref:Glycosyltransferase RgtA/B/C/D-like domain-containing protein n=1 Tax=Edaphobacter acidisoli TaxID=2040573 RepID=A0A916S1R9_9BACT|nr:hypothetical protein [Edaphobacter acidisoli]GGA79365.1 hypothetical protein GCM10011507_33270 [Edaphobacter acidisoli]
MTTRGRKAAKSEPAKLNPVVLNGTGDGEVRPATREETFPVAMAALVLGFLALVVCIQKGYLLLYGDAVAHLGIARRILDSRNPGLVQLGGVWLPLPHLLMAPFAQKMEWWQNGLAGAWPSLVSYIFAVAGIYRLSRRMMTAAWAFAAAGFFALNANLLYLSTTAMTEPLFLAIVIWMVLLTMECVDAINVAETALVSRRLIFISLLILAAVFTRYDGWILGAAVWCVLTWQLAQRRDVWRSVSTSFVVFTLLTVAGPVGWFAYNQHFFHDWLDFMRGPYSAAAIDKRTTPPGAGHYRGWHNPLWALVLYTRSAQVDAAAWETGFGVMAAALAGLVLAIRRRVALASLLLWVPLPFYIYAVAYGSVPIFIPQLYPHSYYNSRYGMEMLPAFAVFTFFAAAWAQEWVNKRQPLAARLMQPIAILLIVLSTIAMMYKVPLVLKEAEVNSTTRVAFEKSLAQVLDSFPPGSPILMYNSSFIGALQDAGIPLRQTINEEDQQSWQIALNAPAEHAAYVVAIAGDAVSDAVQKHPDGLTELTILCTTGQPCARIYQSNKFGNAPSSTHP